ncbi:MAG: transcriptional regulator [Acidobacteriota bacterium]
MAEESPSSERGRALLELDRLVHEPARHLILDLLEAVEGADFVFLLHHSGLTRGNLSSHLAKLEEAGYVEVQKTFVEKVPRTVLRLTSAGRKALHLYRAQMRTFMSHHP